MVEFEHSGDTRVFRNDTGESESNVGDGAPGALKIYSDMIE
jgi:hypothetical protein